jgi:hypothetical protein
MRIAGRSDRAPLRDRSRGVLRRYLGAAGARGSRTASVAAAATPDIRGSASRSVRTNGRPRAKARRARASCARQAPPPKTKVVQPGWLQVESIVRAIPGLGTDETRRGAPTRDRGDAARRSRARPTSDATLSDHLDASRLTLADRRTFNETRSGPTGASVRARPFIAPPPDGLLCRWLPLARPAATTPSRRAPTTSAP